MLFQDPPTRRLESKAILHDLDLAIPKSEPIARMPCPLCEGAFIVKKREDSGWWGCCSACGTTINEDRDKRFLLFYCASLLVNHSPLSGDRPLFEFLHPSVLPYLREAWRHRPNETELESERLGFLAQTQIKKAREKGGTSARILQRIKREKPEKKKKTDEEEGEKKPIIRKTRRPRQKKEGKSE